MEPIRILHENVVMGAGGIESLLMNVYRNIDRKKVQFDFLVHRNEAAFYDDEIRRLGGNIYVTSRFNPLNNQPYLEGMQNVMVSHPEYKIIHCHSELNMWPLRLAARTGIPVRIAHSHNSKTKINLKYFFMKYQQMSINKYCTDRFACSEEAGLWAFGDAGAADMTIIKNGIDAKKFDYDLSVRERVRRKYGLEDKFVIGHVGRFMEQKNHEFIISLFSQFLKVKPDSVLVLVGDGALEKNIREAVKKSAIESKVIFAGVTSDVSSWYQAMDVFLFPSLWEGLGIVMLEAQASGLPCVASTKVPALAKVTDNVKFIGLDEPVEKWVKALKNADTNKRVGRRQSVVDAGFDIKETAEFLQNFYLAKYEEAVKGENK